MSASTAPAQILADVRPQHDFFVGDYEAELIAEFNTYLPSSVEEEEGASP
jgi:hypothetical protein